MLKKHKRAIRDSQKDGSGQLFTTWFETTSTRTISAPPKLHSKCRLQRGDLFLHKHPEALQIWMRTSDDVWLKIEVGYEREDGRQLNITPKLQVPSWVGGDWGARRISASKSIE